MAQTKTQFGYRRHPDQDRPGANVAEHAVVVVGAGPVGLSLAIDLAQRGQRSCCSTMPTGSARARGRSAFPNARSNSGTGSASASAWSTRAWCGVSARFFTASPALPIQPVAGGWPQAAGLHQPAAILCRGLSGRSRRGASAIDLRWRNKVTGLEQRNDHAAADDRTPDGPYRLSARFIVACDGARSSLRTMVARNSRAKCSRISS